MSDKHEELLKALERIASLDPDVDSDEGFNEWGEAECFNLAQNIAREALNKVKS